MTSTPPSPSPCGPASNATSRRPTLKGLELLARIEHASENTACLAASLGTSKARISALLRHLEALSLLSRARPRSDRRRVCVTITALGKTALTTARDVRTRFGLTPDGLTPSPVPPPPDSDQAPFPRVLATALRREVTASLATLDPHQQPLAAGIVIEILGAIMATATQPPEPASALHALAGRLRHALLNPPADTPQHPDRPAP